MFGWNGKKTNPKEAKATKTNTKKSHAQKLRFLASLRFDK
jgi:hypothetical protein